MIKKVNKQENGKKIIVEGAVTNINRIDTEY